jgi:hypothetical protein
MSFIYLASPYTHPEESIMLSRFYQAVDFCAWAFKKGLYVYSPIVHWHPVATIRELPKDYMPWEKQGEVMMNSSRALWVLCLPGWEQSRGVLSEIIYIASLKKEIRFVHKIDEEEYETMLRP